MTDFTSYGADVFEKIKHINEYRQEFWYARELQKALEYTQWRRFNDAITRAKIACENAGQPVLEHFADVGKSSPMPNGGERLLDDLMLSRYACYLIVMNSDTRKEIIAQGQTYFAVQTRRQELSEQFESLSENQKRLAVRQELKEHNKSLAEAAQQSGVKTSYDYAVFQNFGYQGLYGGLGMRQIRERKGLSEKEQILDHMGSTELAANLFRATQTDEKLRRDRVQGKDAANQTHFAVGRKVRQTIKELGGTMPENLPPSNQSIKQLEKEQKKLNSSHEKDKFDR